MNYLGLLLGLSIVFTIIVGFLLWLVVHSRTSVVLKFISLIVGSVLILFFALSISDSLGLPKPFNWEWRYKDRDIVEVVGYDIREGQALYLYLKIEGVDEPRSYVLGWNLKMAEQLQEAGEKAKRSGRRLLMKQPFKKFGMFSKNGDAEGEFGDNQEGDQPGDESHGGQTGRRGLNTDEYEDYQDGSIFYLEPPPPLPPKSY